MNITSGGLFANSQYVGDSGAGGLTQSGGYNIASNLYLGYGSGANGTYTLSGSGQVATSSAQYVGYSGSGSFTQSGGSNYAPSLDLGFNSGSIGMYSLSGTGTLSAGYSSEYIGNSGAGVFNQSGGTNSFTSGIFYLGYNASGNGAYNLSGSGLLSTPTQYVGYSGTGAFAQTGGSNANSGSLYLGANSGASGTYSQSGGSNTIAGSLYVGNNSAATATYSLSGTGQLSTPNEYIASASGAKASFAQSGGTNTATYLTIGAGGTYSLTGGALQASGGIVNQGVFDGGNSPASLAAGGILDLTSGTWKNLSGLSLSMAANSLLLAPAGFNPATALAGYTSQGLTHNVGTTLIVPAGKGFAGTGSINDPVDCQGTITASSGNGIDLNNGLTLSGSGNIALGGGSLTVNDASSGMTAGSLSVTDQNVGRGADGTFTQSGGTSSASHLYVGFGANDQGIYNLSGTGNMSATFEFVGYYGTGIFSHTGGTNAPSALYVGCYNGSNGSYSLSGGQLSAGDEHMGYVGMGGFTQSGGTNTLSGTLYLGDYAGGSGAYSLSAGQLLSSKNQFIGSSGTGAFRQSGGTNNAAGTLYLGYSPGGSGSYSLGGTGVLSANIQYVGSSGTGTFTQSGGTNNVAGTLFLGYSSGGSGTYSLSGTGTLSAPTQYIGFLPTAQASFQQSGGTNTAGYVVIGATGQYVLSGGSLQISGYGLVNQGVFDGGNGSGSLSGTNCIIDLSQGTLRYVGSLSVGMGNNSLLMVPAGFDPTTGFGNNSWTGLTHVAGTTLVVPAGKGFTGWGSINDPVDCQGGTITAAAGGAINLNNGLMLSGNGNVNLGTGSLTVSDTTSPNITGGSLVVYDQIGGKNGAGQFTQSAGTSVISHALYVAFSSSYNDSYNLSGTGNLSAPNQYVGYAGTGAFNQTGGTNLSTQALYVGYNSTGTGTYNQSGGANSSPTIYLGFNSGSSGAYVLSGTGQLSATDQYVGYSGAGAVTQSGGSNSLSGSLYLGYNSNASGTYSLGGTGQLSVQQTETVGGSGAATFTQTGGTNNVPGYVAVGTVPGNTAAYALSGGQLSTAAVAVGYGGSGTFTQTGGTVAMTMRLLLGWTSASNGTYNLGGTGQLSAPDQEIGYAGATGLFQQTGGVNSAGYLNISSSGKYVLSGGTLQVSGYELSSQGVLNGGNAAGTLDATSCIVDLSQGTLQNVGSMLVNVDSNSLLIVPSTFNPLTGFSKLTSSGLTHVAGTTLVVPAGKGFGGWGSINDPVVCQGTITAAAGISTYLNLGINLNAGLTLSGAGNVALGTGSLTVNDTASAVTGGLFRRNASSSAAAERDCSASPAEPVPCRTFSSAPTAAWERTTSAAADNFRRSVRPSVTPAPGSSRSRAGPIPLRSSTSPPSAAATAPTILTAEPSALDYLAIGSGTGAFNFNGGTLTAANSFSAALPIRLGTAGSNATFDTDAYQVGFSGLLTGPGNLLKTGTGTLALSGADSLYRD